MGSMLWVLVSGSTVGVASSAMGLAYLFALVVGMGILMFQAVMGSKDADADGDVDGDLDADARAGAPVEVRRVRVLAGLPRVASIDEEEAVKRKLALLTCDGELELRRPQ